MSNFSKAFAAARKAGKKTFSFGGKSYHTRLKGEAKSPGKTPVPQSKPTGKIPTPTPKPSRDVQSRPGSGAPKPKAPTPKPKPKPGKPEDLGKTTGKVPTPKSNPRNAPGVGIAKKGSAIAVAAQRRTERAVAAKPSDRPKAPAKKTDAKGVPLTRTSQDYRGIVIKKKPKTPDQKSKDQPKMPVPKSNPRNAPATGIAKKGSPLAIAFKRLSELSRPNRKDKNKKTGGGGW